MLSFSLVGQNYNLTTYEIGIYTDSIKTFSEDGWSYFLKPTGNMIVTEDQYNYSSKIDVSYSQQQNFDVEIEKEFTNNELNYGDIKITMTFDQEFGGNSDIKLYYIDDNNDTTNIDNQPIVFNVETDYTFTFTKPSGISISKLKIVIDGNTNNQFPFASTYELLRLKIEVDGTTNIQENIANNFNVYSYNKNLVVKTTALENYSIRIYNLSGQEVLVKNAQGNQEIPLTLTTGMYIVNINNGKESYNQKVMVQ